jgi:hypothetical protein
MPAPLIQLDTAGTASVLRYDIPEPTSYEGKNFIKLEFDDNVFSQAALEMPSSSASGQLKDLPLDAIKAEVERYVRTGSSTRAELPDLPVGVLRANVASLRRATSVEVSETSPSASAPPPEPPDDDVLESLAERLREGYHLVKTTNLYGEQSVTPVPPIPTNPDPHLYLVESLRLTSYLGDYGAGRIVKTFSLLPGESTKISVKTYRSTESTKKAASSVLDSLTQESASSLETAVMTEQSDQQSFQETQEYYAEASGSASWGIGSASGKAGIKGGSNSARQETVKNVSNATQKHSASASAKREVDIDTSYEVSEKAGEETSIERQIDNINRSRTLNFVFRQMNQEFVTFLHLTDVRVGFFNGDGASRREVPLPAIGSLLAEVVKPSKQQQVRDIILEQLSAVRDYAGNIVDVVDTVSISAGDEYRQFDPTLTTPFVDRNGRQYDVPGVLLKVDYLVMRTDGVIVEALLGEGDALDDYAKELQSLEVERRGAEVSKLVADGDRVRLGNKAGEDNDKERAAILASLMCCPECGHGHKHEDEPS